MTLHRANSSRPLPLGPSSGVKVREGVSYVNGRVCCNPAGGCARCRCEAVAVQVDDELRERVHLGPGRRREAVRIVLEAVGL